MKYLLLIYDNEASWLARSEEERQAIYAEYYAFDREARAAGVVIDGAELAPTATATSVRVRGEALLSDGPFAETKEQLGGYYLLDCASLDEALGWAKKLPGAKYGTVEVRPLMEQPC